jgi:hypothetical protein
MSPTLTERLETPIAGEYDVIVAGAGPAGVPAAVAAARTGARTLLIESASCLGGTWTAGILTWVFDIEKNGIGQEIIQRLTDRQAYVESDRRRMVCFTYDVETMKLTLEEMCEDNGVDVLLHTRVVAANVDHNRRIRAVVTESKSGRQAWRAKTFVDATGDGDLGAQAGCSFDFGSEAGEIQPMTYMAAIVVPDHRPLERFISFYAGSGEHRARTNAFKAYLADIDIDASYGVPTLFQIRGNLLALMVNHEYGVVSHDALQVTEATIRARAEVNRIVDALTTSPGPFNGCLLASTAEYIGVRDGRRLRGRYHVTVDDLQRGARFEDAVARVRFGVDVHAIHPEDKHKGNIRRGIQIQPYDIPMRALIAQEVDGLLMAGRCISGDWLAHASYRVTGEAVSMGEAAGTLAGVSAQTGRAPHEVPWAEVAPLIPECPDFWRQ